ncbi:pro-sigmaK processing inhibitor BofA family protein [Paenibacillus sp. J5C_2022]|uniref:pro-sigmaK processing inhibitor BofA family protein n=1 Tax=Paenibacillus sp. J5C2022 TaxID=2977129 RepID=UPI0021D11217|nr:pro-sigmaK processing inhibitor BofA family protein [Paenibacillus sp. J5C2022]MCU6710677.1 pro-sigmaK processing inhibitor BofA family protein [Paenibacillus sp. J5C2022]
MKWLWLSVLIGSSVLLLGVILRHKLSWGWVKGFALHLVLAAGLLYVLNYAGIMPGLFIPINPVTVGTIVVLGLPGVALLAGLQWFVV